MYVATQLSVVGPHVSPSSGFFSRVYSQWLYHWLLKFGKQERKIIGTFWKHYEACLQKYLSGPNLQLAWCVYNTWSCYYIPWHTGYNVNVENVMIINGLNPLSAVIIYVHFFGGVGVTFQWATNILSRKK